MPHASPFIEPNRARNDDVALYTRPITPGRDRL
jgi:hypothetical protein